MAARAESTKILRIGHVAPSLGVGGLEKMLVDFARRTDPRRFETVYFSVTDGGPVADELRECGKQVVEMGKPSGVKPGVAFALARRLREQRIDVVHTHNDAALLYGVPAARLAGVGRVIHTRHGYEPRSRALAAALKPISHLATRIVCVSEDNKRIAFEQGTPRAKTIVILNGVDRDRFPYAGPTIGGPVVAVARLSPEKGVENLVRAVAIARPHAPDLRVEIAGGGQLMEQLQALAAELRVDDVITFLGETRNISALLARASLFVLPSLTEGVSLTLLEAMATGLPIVATRVGGNPEVIAEGETGWLVPASAPEDLANAIVRALSEPARLAAWGRAGRARIETRFDLQRTIAAYERLYLGRPLES